MILVPFILALAVTRAAEVTEPVSINIPIDTRGFEQPSAQGQATLVLEMSPDAARRILDRLDEADRRIKAIEQQQADLRGWWLDTAIVITGTSIDMLSTGAFRDDPSRNMTEANSLIGNGPGAAEKHVALKAVGVAAASIVCHELRVHGHPREARIVSLIFGGGFAALGARNYLLK